ncbi:hypothetical protein L2D08_04965 [Domibacillus sp. PGB-M46]|uniref:hypothetical protein n=1 Tax=Domibacillus sp. PGB-M46 TaxID=2910255 RepID=UPI001F5625D8|nr:hypothetical protein [Domibacillus sp. PGB-M46]MCI2253710.1 hypothetical protein [Domibacillus sp. PGB-M46]
MCRRLEKSNRRTAIDSADRSGEAASQTARVLSSLRKAACIPVWPLRMPFPCYWRTGFHMDNHFAEVRLHRSDHRQHFLGQRSVAFRCPQAVVFGRRRRLPSLIESEEICLNSGNEFGISAPSGSK